MSWFCLPTGNIVRNPRTDPMGLRNAKHKPPPAGYIQNPHYWDRHDNAEEDCRELHYRDCLLALLKCNGLLLVAKRIVPYLFKPDAQCPCHSGHWVTGIEAECLVVVSLQNVKGILPVSSKCLGRYYYQQCSYSC